MDAHRTLPVASQARTCWRTLLLPLLFIAPILAQAAEEPRQQRQTVFGDHNYTPSTRINTLPPTATRQQPPARTAAPAAIKSDTVKVEWIDARGTKTDYRMYYEHDGNTIDFASVCSNHRSGSINYRTCRKAARQWFGTKCNGGSTMGKMYCQARNAFRP